MTVRRPRAADGVVGDPVAGPTSGAAVSPAAAEVTPPRLARYRVKLASGTEVGVSICGGGVPLVVVHGFAAEGILYAQTLSRLVRMGFRVIAIDSPGHGGTDSVSTLAPLGEYVGLLAETLDHLGVRQAVLAGHSMGGRLVAELAAKDPGRAIAVILLDAIVGDPWDRMVAAARFLPGAYLGFGLGLLADTAATLPVWSNPRQAAKLARLVFPTGAHHVRRPWRLAGPVLSIARSTPSGKVLDRLRHHGVPVVVIHGDRDYAVPLCTARSTARRTGGELVVVHGARHSWLLRDPETFPAILAQLLDRDLGDALAEALGAGPDGPRPPRAGGGERVAQAEELCYEPGSLALTLTPASPKAGRSAGRHGAPRYRWSSTDTAAD